MLGDARTAKGDDLDIADGAVDEWTYTVKVDARNVECEPGYLLNVEESNRVSDDEAATLGGGIHPLRLSDRSIDRLIDCEALESWKIGQLDGWVQDINVVQQNGYDGVAGFCMSKI